MLKILAHLLVSMLAIWLTDYLIDGVHIYGDWMNVLLVTIVLGVVNATIGALLKTLTFPLSLITFGLVSFLISGLMVLVADYFLKSFSVDTYWYGLLVCPCPQYYSVGVQVNVRDEEITTGSNLS